MAAAASFRCSSVVFVGNIPCQVAEAELRDACEEIGPVVSLRVAADKETGKPRGFAFVEYLDDETARSACRNLDGHALRVGRAERQQGGGVSAAAAAGPDQPVGVEDATHAASLVSGAPPSAAVTAYLAGLSRRQLREMVDAVGAQGDVAVEQMKRRYAGLATVIEQARILLDMADAAAAAKAKKGRRVRDHHPEAQVAPKLRKLMASPVVSEFWDFFSTTVDSRSKSHNPIAAVAGRFRLQMGRSKHREVAGILHSARPKMNKTY